jgi:hypothetical protein
VRLLNGGLAATGINSLLRQRAVELPVIVLDAATLLDGLVCQGARVLRRFLSSGGPLGDDASEKDCQKMCLHISPPYRTIR